VKIPVPHSEAHPTTRVTVETPKGTFFGFFDHSHREWDVKLPEGVSATQVSIHAEYLGRNGKVDPRMRAVILLEAQPAPPEPIVEPVAEPTVEPTVEPIVDPVAECVEEAANQYGLPRTPPSALSDPVAECIESAASHYGLPRTPPSALSDPV
jgi:hypothetical protein